MKQFQLVQGQNTLSKDCCLLADLLEVPRIDLYHKILDRQKFSICYLQEKNVLTHQVPRNFFSNFSTIFGYSTPSDPQETNPEEKKISTGSTLFRYGRKRPVGTYRGTGHQLSYYYEF
jgi:hypothetical protein